MKKINLIIIFVLSLCITTNVNGATYANEEIANSSFIIGEMLFTNESSEDYLGYLTTQYIMLASQTIDSNDLEDMIIYNKTARGLWYNALTGEQVDPPETFEINYTDFSGIYETYNITYILNDGEFDDEPVTSIQQGDNTITIDIPSKEGYEFVGWEYNNEITYTLNLYYGDLTDDVNLVAVWEETPTPSSCFTVSYITADAVAKKYYASITGYDTSCGVDVTIPSIINGAPVISIGSYAFSSRTSNSLGIESVVFNESSANENLSITINDYAFYNNNISTLILNDQITSIGSYAFAENKIESVDLPESLTYISDYVFYENELETIDIPANIYYIGERAFAYNNLTSLYIPTYVEVIESHAFAYNEIKTLTISSANTVGLEIEYGAFYDNRLYTLNFDNISYIGNYAFAYNYLIEGFTIPDNSRYLYIEALAFENQKETEENSLEFNGLSFKKGSYLYSDYTLEENVYAIYSYEDSFDYLYLDYTCYDCDVVTVKMENELLEEISLIKTSFYSSPYNDIYELPSDFTYGSFKLYIYSGDLLLDTINVNLIKKDELD